MHTIFAHWILPVSQAPVRDGFIRVDKGRIIGIGSAADADDSPEKQAFIANSHNEETSIITPGLVNAHCHLEQTFGTRVEKTAEQPMSDWLRRVTERNRQYGSPEDTEVRCIRGAKALAASGTTCVNDISGLHGISLGVLNEFGLRGMVSPEFFHPPADPVRVTEVIAVYKKLQDAYKAHPLLKVGLSPHTPFNVSPSAWRVIIKECTDQQTQQAPVIHTHIAESKDEANWVSGKPSDIDTLHTMFAERAFAPMAAQDSPVLYMKYFGLLNNHTIAAHLVYTSEADRKILKDSGLRIAHCPRSNLYLQGETLRWDDWHDTGIPVGLGTDGQLSTENLDLREEARVAIAQHGFNAETALRLMTMDGARVMGLESEIGSLEKRKSADYVVWTAPQSLAGLAPEEQVLSAETTAQKVVVAGRSLDLPKPARGGRR